MRHESRASIGWDDALVIIRTDAGLLSTWPIVTHINGNANVLIEDN